jgi:retinol dehydrogenase-12
MAAPWTEMLPPAPAWTEKDMTEQSGRVFLVTGGTSGIGYETARALYHLNGTVYITSRSASSAEASIKSMKTSPPHPSQLVKSGRGILKYLILNLSDLNSIKATAETLLTQEKRLDVVWHNAGVMIPDDSSALTIQGHHQQLGVNALAPFLLQHFLTPIMLQTASLPSTSPNSVRVIWVSSNSHHASPMPDGVAWENIELKNDKTGLKIDMERYSQSKAMNVMQAYEFARLYHGNGIVSLSLHPGGIATNLQKNSPGWFNYVLGFLRYHPRFGALTELFAGLKTLQDGEQEMLEDGGWNGGYIYPFGRFGPGNKEIFDGLCQRRTGERLWAVCTEMVKEFL